MQFGDGLDPGVLFESEVSVQQQTQIRVLATDYSSQRIVERIRVPQWRWHTKNEYWIDPQSGLTRRSVQNLRPDLPAISLELLHLPASRAG
jgi:hypothetical protein